MVYELYLYDHCKNCEKNLYFAFVRFNLIKNFGSLITDFDPL